MRRLRPFSRLLVASLASTLAAALASCAAALPAVPDQPAATSRPPPSPSGSAAAQVAPDPWALKGVERLASDAARLAPQLKLLASTGVQVTGVDVWALLRALYAFPGDQGKVTGPRGEEGSVRLLDGRFPADPSIVRAVGGGYTLILSKNVLKRGYLHPERPVADPKRLIHLDVPDEVAIRAFYDALAPGGHFLIYNISPAPTPLDKPFIPWSDGRCPFTKAQLEAAGFEVLELDKDDLAAVQGMARALGWDQPEDGEPGMDLVNDLSVLYTLVRRPSRPAGG